MLLEFDYRGLLYAKSQILTGTHLFMPWYLGPYPKSKIWLPTFSSFGPEFSKKVCNSPVE